MGQWSPEADADAAGMSLSWEQRWCEVKSHRRWLCTAEDGSAESVGSLRCPVVCPAPICPSRQSHAVSFLCTDTTAEGKSRAS